MNKNKKKKVLIVVLGILVALVIVFAALLLSGVIDLNKPEPIPEVDPEPQVEVRVQPERQLWLDNKSINVDYVGEVVFDSGIINQPFVQADDVYDENGNFYHFYNENGSVASDPDLYNGNDVYIWTNWRDMTYDYNILGGSVFMDYRNVLSDQNIIIYGHHFSEGGGNDPDRNKAFTPLEKLLESKNYQDGKTLKLILDNETRSYELVGVYKYDVNDEFCVENMQYYRTTYNYDEFSNSKDDEYYSNYIKGLDKLKLYDTDCTLTTDDNTLTLQTCISGQAGYIFEICVYKEVDVEYFD